MLCADMTIKASFSAMLMMMMVESSVLRPFCCIFYQKVSLPIICDLAVCLPTKSMPQDYSFFQSMMHTICFNVT